MKNDDYETLNEILDKLLQVQAKEKKVSILKIILCIFGCIAALTVISFLCLMIYKNNFSMESLLALLLAFFSIFISVFFYIKASDTSNKFYDNSYNFMKDISVTLGKIEERFGEKLNSLNEKISHISEDREEKTEELHSTENEKQAIINELFEKSRMNNDEKEEYRQKLKEKEIEAERLRIQLQNLDMEFRQLRQGYSNDNILNEFVYQLTDEEAYTLLKGEPNKFIMKKAQMLGIMNDEGLLTDRGKMLLIRRLHKRKNAVINE